jgi:antitoxin FitA
MATIQIRNIPDEVYLTYKERALRARQSLQEYLLGKLVEDARQPTLTEILDRASDNAVESVTTADIITELDRGRSER